VCPNSPGEPISLEEAKRRFPPMWVIYNRPLDFPECMVCRLWYGDMPTDEVMLGDSLEQMRRKVMRAGGCFNLGRFIDDEPHIVECWV
jgi:hypothetical protein